MFDIKYRIIIDVDRWKSSDFEHIEKEGGVEGFFQIIFNTIEYGYFHDRELAPDEQGFDIISTWFDNLLEVCILLESSGYVALKDIETYNTWIEFIHKENQISVSLMKSDSFTSDYIILQPLITSTYPEWKDLLISKDEFTYVVVQRTKDFINELTRINKHFLSSQRIVSLLNLISRIK